MKATGISLPEVHGARKMLVTSMADRETKTPDTSETGR